MYQWLLRWNNVPAEVRDAFDAAHPFKLADSLLVLAYVGSKSHNTYVPKDDPASVDDIDLMGIVVPPPGHVLGLSSFEHWTYQKGEWDVVLYSLSKFAGLLAKANPNVLGLLWLRDAEVLYARPEWDEFLAKRAAFSTKAAYPAFAGYARGQLQRMTSFTPDLQDRYDSAVAVVEAAGWTKDQIVQGRGRPMPDVAGLLEHLRRSAEALHVLPPTEEEARVVLDAAIASVKSIHAKHHMGYMGEKRKRLVRRFGYDVKNAAHLVRLMRMCVEFLVSGNLRVYRTADAATIREIKSGVWSLDEVKAEAEKLFGMATAALEWSPLSELVDPDVANRLVVNTYRSMWGWR